MALCCCLEAGEEALPLDDRWAACACTTRPAWAWMAAGLLGCPVHVRPAGWPRGLALCLGAASWPARAVKKCLLRAAVARPNLPHPVLSSAYVHQFPIYFFGYKFAHPHKRLRHTHAQQPPGLLARRSRRELLSLGERLNADGLRVLAVALRELPSVGEALAAAATLGEVHSGAASSGTSPRSLYWKPADAGAGGAASPGAGDSGGASPRTPPTPPGGQRRGPSPFCGSAASLASLGISFSADDEAGMRFVGFLAFLDPPKESARQAVAELHAKSGGGGLRGMGGWVGRGRLLAAPRQSAWRLLVQQQQAGQQTTMRAGGRAGRQGSRPHRSALSL